jgi:hypothetical protein
VVVSGDEKELSFSTCLDASMKSWKNKHAIGRRNKTGARHLDDHWILILHYIIFPLEYLCYVYRSRMATMVVL